MSTDKRELLRRLAEESSWKQLSWYEIRLYLFLVVCASEGRRKGGLDVEAIKKCLGDGFSRQRLEKAAHNLERLHLVKIDISPSASKIEFEFLK